MGFNKAITLVSIFRDILCVLQLRAVPSFAPLKLLEELDLSTYW